MQRDERFCWKASWRFGGDLVIRDRRENGRRRFAYHEKEDAYRWLWEEWREWYHGNCGDAFWEDAVDEKRLLPPAKDGPPDDRQRALLELKEFMRQGNEDSESFFWRWSLKLCESGPPKEGAK